MRDPGYTGTYDPSEVPPLKDGTWETIQSNIDAEGLDYFFSDINAYTIRDPHLSALTLEYQTARMKLSEYLEAQGVEVE